MEEREGRESTGDQENPRGSLKCYQPLGLFFLSRLSRFVRLRRGVNFSSEGGRKAFYRNLLSKAIYSTYEDCRQLGLSEDANALLNAGIQTSKVQPQNP